jgi:hypothetical protein
MLPYLTLRLVRRYGSTIQNSNTVSHTLSVTQQEKFWERNNVQLQLANQRLQQTNIQRHYRDCLASHAVSHFEHSRRCD